MAVQRNSLSIFRKFEDLDLYMCRQLVNAILRCCA